ncbi:MAG: hypothetical protein QOF98_2567 [Streptomyces sp.]|nr:hypothetical protein [Streptomyces sp.]
MTTQSPHLSARPRGAAAPGPAKAGPVQTRLPWWALVLPAVAFAALLAMLTAGSAHASAAAPAGDAFSRVITSLRDVVHHLL